ncbi:MAG TPA: teichoic acid biosynthesis protein B [Lachnospiraceae bacterium]|nr:teichoic acid biosynthesis protein B [Lachnospiraceae bacterium]
MKQRFWNKLREVSLNDFWHIILFLLALFPAFIYKKKRRHLWLICENKEEARDNGYWLFHYIREKEPDVDVVYAIAPDSPDYDKVASLGKTVAYGTWKHWIYYLAAEINISSQKGGKPNAAVCYFLEVYGIRNNLRVFLQHGITKDDASFLHYENSKISLFVTSTQREYEYVRDNFNYPAGYVKLLGMCRFDNLHKAVTNEKQILVMPTWRSWISPPSNGKAEFEGIREIKNSEYFRGWDSFLQYPRLHCFLEEQDKYLVFYQHREMRKFKGLFQSFSPRIQIAEDNSYDVQSLLMESAYLITDYSSIAMDFAYMGKPLSYYQFDYEKFREKQYSEGYFSYEADGFGPVCYTKEELMNTLLNYLRNGFPDEEKYKKRRENFFTLKDTENCKRNFEAIRELVYGGR